MLEDRSSMLEVSKQTINGSNNFSSIGMGFSPSFNFKLHSALAKIYLTQILEIEQI
ncbi:hypothetical protein [Chryseobacterium schmidteae]|uniref:hypothetical protein n=1 Tax=Chryseobacterium schmidteae TaxID=2730404 RepID=UPI00158EFA84|nr:hypothetical protein [Chryseobacterium schmidteae]